jgi:hypothetical protein
MPRVEFESTIPVFERAKTVHALDRAANVIGLYRTIYSQKDLARCMRSGSIDNLWLGT